MSGKSVALSDRGNCRGDAPQYMDTAYSRDIARRLITAPKRTQKGTPPHTPPPPVKIKATRPSRTIRRFLRKSNPRGTPIDTESHGLKQAGWI